MNNKILLGSSSASRQQLLKDVGIPFQLVEQLADETKCDWTLPLPQVVENIARYKMEHVVLPATATEGETIFVLTADTLCQNNDGTIHGKPVDRADAIKKIKETRGGASVCTAFCLDKKVWRAGAWQLEKRIEQHVRAEYDFNVPDEWIETYFDHSLGLKASGAIAIEQFGLMFLKSVNGSFSTIVGLPLYELREALDSLGFWQW